MTHTTVSIDLLGWVAAALSAGVVLLLLPAQPVVAAPAGELDFARGVEHLRAGQVPPAYGRFILAATAGHPQAARHALQICLRGLELYGKDLDCTLQDVEDWARTAGVPVPTFQARTYPPKADTRRVSSR